MPSWCNNDLWVQGPEEDIARFKAQACAPVQTYNDFSGFAVDGWPVEKLRALTDALPADGPIVDFSFHGLVPVPDDIRRYPYDCRIAKTVGAILGEPKTQGGHGWEKSNWGCKWGACNTKLYGETETELWYSLDTPWGPPLIFLRKVSERWPTLRFIINYDGTHDGEGRCWLEGGKNKRFPQRPRLADQSPQLVTGSLLVTEPKIRW
mgnify:CR=1 FL=1